MYKAQVTSSDDGIMKDYIGMRATSFKERYSNHKKSFNIPKYSKETALSNYIWDVKRKGKDYTV